MNKIKLFLQTEQGKRIKYEVKSFLVTFLASGVVFEFLNVLNSAIGKTEIDINLIKTAVIGLETGFLRFLIAYLIGHRKDTAEYK